MIRLLSVIAHGIELVPHFIKHYQNQVDEINFIIYETGGNGDLYSEVSKIIEYKERVNIINVVKNNIFDWGAVTKYYNKAKSKHPDDWWVIADIDEFHVYPFNDLGVLIEDCIENKWDIVRGGFIDRIGKNGEMPHIMSKPHIFKQFPMMGFFRYPLSNACPNKICVMKGYVELTNGQHYANIEGNTTWRWQGWSHPLIAPYETHSVQVHHFKWDSTCVERIKSVADIKQDYAFSSEYKLMYDRLSENNFKIDIKNPEFMFEVSKGSPKYTDYKQWDKLIKKIVII